jgi:hypothetical protein
VIGTVVKSASLSSFEPSLLPTGEICYDLPTAIRTRIIPRTPLHTIRAPRLADVERQRLAVLRDVGRDVVLADARVGERVGVAFVVERGERVDARLLRAD